MHSHQIVSVSDLTLEPDSTELHLYKIKLVVRSSRLKDLPKQTLCQHAHIFLQIANRSSAAPPWA